MYTTLIRESEGTVPVNRRADLKLSIETQVHQDESKKGRGRGGAAFVRTMQNELSATRTGPAAPPAT